jgi:ketosteroid isomerase-like protein
MPRRRRRGTLPGMTAKEILTEMMYSSDRGDYDRFRALLDPRCEWVNPMIQAEGADEIARAVADFSAAFPQRRHEIEQMIESGESVAIEGEWVATHESGRTVRSPFAAITRVHDGRVAAVRLYIDTAALMSQLAPAPAPA